MTNETQKLIIIGKKSYEAGDYLAAAQAFADAANLFAAAADPINEAEMKNNQSVALLQAGDAQAALDAVEGTAGVFADSGDVRRQALALGNQGSALEALDRLDEAADLYVRSAELLESIGEKEMLSTVLKSLSAIQVRLKQPFDAVLTMQSSLAAKEKPSLKERILKKLLRFRFL